MSIRREFGSVVKRPDRRWFYIRFRWEGRRIWRRGGHTRAVAAEKLSDCMALLSRGHPLDEVLAEVFRDGVSSGTSFRGAVDPYLEFAKPRKKESTLASDVRRFRVLCKGDWSAKSLTDIRPHDLERWAAARLSAGTSGATINRDLSLASALFLWALRMGYTDANPVRRVEKFSEKGRERELYLTPEEVRALIADAEPLFRPVLLTAVLTGMRRGEILALRWRSIDFARRQIIVEAKTVKTSKTRAIPMARDLENALRVLRRSQKVTSLKGSDTVFTFPDGSPLTADAAKGMFTRTRDRCKAIPLEKRRAITFHTLRHTAASLMAKAGVSLSDVGRILGHASTQTTMRYSHLYADETRGAVDRLGAMIGLGRQPDREPKAAAGGEGGASRGPPPGPPTNALST